MTKKHLQEVVTKLISDLPKGYHDQDIERWKTALAGADSKLEIEEIEREIYSHAATWSPRGIASYDAHIFEERQHAESAKVEQGKYAALLKLLGTARENYEKAHKRLGRDAYEKGVQLGERLIDADLPREMQAEETAQSSIDKANEALEKANNIQSTTDYQEAEAKYYIDSYGATYLGSIKGLFAGIKRGKFEKLPNIEKAKAIKAYLDETEEPTKPYVRFETKGSDGKSASDDVIARLASEYAADNQKFSATAVSQQALADSLTRSIERLEARITHCKTQINIYDSFIKASFEDRAKIIEAAAEGAQEAFVEAYLAGEPRAIAKFDRESRLLYAKRDLAALNVAAGANPTPEQLLEIAALNGYIQGIERQEQLTRDIVGHISDPVVAKVLEADMALDSYDYLDRAFSHYYQQAYAALPNQNTAAIDEATKKLFGKYISNLPKRIHAERIRAQITTQNFQTFRETMLQPVVADYAKESAIVSKVDKLLEEKGKALEDRRVEVLATRIPSEETVLEYRTDRKVVRRNVEINRESAREIDRVSAYPIVEQYTKLTMIREELAAKDKKYLSAEERKILQEVSVRLEETIVQAQAQGLLGELIEANKVAVETNIPGYDKLKAFAEAKGIDLTTEEGRKALRDNAAVFQAEFDKVFPVKPVHQPKDRIEELQLFIASNPSFKDKFKIDYVDGKPYLNQVEYILNPDGTPRTVDGEPFISSVEQKGFELTDEMLDNPEFLAAFGFDPNTKKAIEVKQPVKYDILTMLDQRDSMIKDPVQGISLYGQVGVFTDLSELEAAKQAAFDDAYFRYKTGKSKNYYDELVAIAKAYTKAAKSMYGQEKQEQMAEEYVESVTREEKLATAVESKKINTSKLGAAKQNARAATVIKKLEAIEKGIVDFQNADPGATNDNGKFLEEALADTFAQTLAYATRYNITEEVLAQVEYKREQSTEAFISLEMEEELDPNDPTKTISKPKIVRTLEDGSTHTYSIGENGKINITVQDPVQNQDEGQTI